MSALRIDGSGEDVRDVAGPDQTTRRSADVARPDDMDLRVREAAPVGRDLQAARWHGEVALRLFGTAPPTTTVGRYQLVERRGQGASGEVWAAIDPELDRRVALKILHAELGPEPAHAAMIREAKALAKLSHPNVLPVFDAGVHDGRVFMALELVEGTTMRAWMAGMPRWPEVVDVFAQAARGLLAAHIAGIVHRDVKPENILIGADGRVRVSDFGIARPAGARDAADSLDTLESTAGIGTPAYMAPEQFLGDPVDARTDQFGLCVALHEALWGERPFVGRDRTMLAANVIAGRRRPPPPESEVPRWLGRVVSRGLSIDPARRWPDLAALLRALEQPRRRRGPIAIGVAAMGLVTLAWAPWQTPPAPACDDGSARLGAVWNGAAADRIRDAFAQTGTAHADERASALVAEFDRFGEAWRSAHDDACLAEVDEGTRIAQQYCLHTRLLELQSMAAAFAQADAAVVEHAARGGTTLRAPGECLYLVPPMAASTTDPQQDLELRAAIATARALGDVGRLERGLVMVGDAVARAQELGSRSLEAEALLVTAELQAPLVGNQPDVDPMSTLHAALLAAEAAHRPDLVALVVVATMESELTRGDYDRAKQLEPRARAIAATMGDPPELVGRIDLAAAEVLIMERQHAASVALLERARDRFEHSGPSSRRWLAQALNLLGETEFRAGAYAAARPQYERALGILRQDLRAHHLLLANASGNLAETYFVVGDFATAAQHFEEALAIRREMFGDDSVWVRHTLGHLGDLAWERGDPERALEAYTAALAHAEPPVGPETLANVLRDLQAQQQRSWMHNGAALALLDLGRLDEALVHAELGDDAPLAEDSQHPDLTGRIDVRGLVLLAMGRTDEAVAALDAALSRLEHGYPDGARAVAFASIGLGRALLAAGHRDRAAAALQRGLEMFAATPRAYPRLQAAARFALGQAWAEDPLRVDRGREQVRAAIALLADAEGTAARERDAMLAWSRAAP